MKAGSRAVIGLQHNILAQNAPQHLGHVANQLVQIHVGPTHDLFAAENEQLPRQAGGALGGLNNLVRTIDFSPGQAADSDSKEALPWMIGQ